MAIFNSYVKLPEGRFFFGRGRGYNVALFRLWFDLFAHLSMDWFKGKSAGKPHIEWENLWFPVKIFP